MFSLYSLTVLTDVKTDSIQTVFPINKFTSFKKTALSSLFATQLSSPFTLHRSFPWKPSTEFPSYSSVSANCWFTKLVTKTHPNYAINQTNWWGWTRKEVTRVSCSLSEISCLNAVFCRFAYIECLVGGFYWLNCECNLQHICWRCALKLRKVTMIASRKLKLVQGFVMATKYRFVELVHGFVLWGHYSGVLYWYNALLFRCVILVQRSVEGTIFRCVN